MEKFRLQRLFNPSSQRTLIVAIDHALFNNTAFLPGIEDMAKSVKNVADAEADGVLLSVGEAPHLQRLPGRNKGGDVDSFQRGIYIHGTNDEASIGTPASHGCVRLKNDDVIAAYEKIPVGALVLITE